MNILQEFSFRKVSWFNDGRTLFLWTAGFAILMHVVGLIGLLFVNRSLFVNFTPIHLLIMPLLLFPFVQGKASRFIMFFLICFFTGWFSEWIGVKTGWLFGNYAYGNVLGVKLGGVPLLIGLNWFMVVYGSAAWVTELPGLLRSGTGLKKIHFPPWFRNMAFLFGAASMTVVYDLFLETVAIRLGYWKWLGDGVIPFKNYLCWFGLSFLLLTTGRLLRVNVANKMASILFSIQLIFFIILGLMLK